MHGWRMRTACSPLPHVCFVGRPWCVANFAPWPERLACGVVHCGIQGPLSWGRVSSRTGVVVVDGQARGLRCAGEATSDFDPDEAISLHFGPRRCAVKRG